MLANPALLVDSLRQRVGGEPSHRSCLAETWRYQGGAMPTAVRRTKLVHVNNQEPRRYRLPILAAALTAAGLLSLGQAHATVINDSDGNEPTNNDITGATLTSSLSNTFQGCVGARCLASINPFTVANDPADYVGYTGLDSGLTYILSVREFPGEFSTLNFAVFLNGESVPTYTQTLGAPGSPVPFQFPDLTSISSVIVGVTFGAKNPGG